MSLSAFPRPLHADHPHTSAAVSVPRRHAREQAVLASVLTGLSARRSAVVTVTGATGFGQDALARWSSHSASARGLRVLSARATPAESGLRYGVVAQLLASLRADLAEGSPLPTGHSCPPAPAEVLHACRQRPTLLAVEDAHWLDAESLRWLHLLARRASSAPVVLLAAGSAATVSGPDWREVVVSSPGPVGVRELALGPLTAAHVADAVLDACGAPGAEEFLVAAHRTTAENPAVLHDTLCRFARRGHPPEAKRVPELRAIGAAVLDDHVDRGLRGLPEETVSLLHALAVCGAVLEFPLVCVLAGLRHLGEARLRAAVAATGFVSMTPTGPRLDRRVRTRLLEGMSHSARADLHARAAELAHRAAADDRAVARLLLGARPVGTAWAVHALKRAGRTAGREGDHTRSTACLARALREATDPTERAQLTFDLAAAELVTLPEAGRRRLAELVRSRDTAPDLRVRALDLALTDGGSDVLRQAAAEALPTTPGPERDDLIALFWAADQAAPERAELMVPEVPALPDHPASPAQAGQRAWQLAVRGVSLPVARQLARAALAVPARRALILPRLSACRALCLTEDYEEAEAGLTSLLAELHLHDLGVVVPHVLTARAELHLRCGRLAAAQRDVAAAETAASRVARHPLSMPHLRAVRLLVDLESGHHREAGPLAPEPEIRPAQDSGYWPHLLFARGLVHASEGDLRMAVGLLKECGRQLLNRHEPNPALIPWRSFAARFLRMTGGRTEAERLSRDELRLARGWGAAGAIGWAELNAGPDAGQDRLTRARRAVHRFGSGPASPGYLRALAELAAAERAKNGSRITATAALDELSVLTSTHPHSPMAARTRLLARLAQRTEPQPQPADAPSPAWAELSPREARTALLAAHGHSNSHIAELLSVSRRTVELRLSSAYTKLRISGRQELRALVRAREGARNVC